MAYKEVLKIIPTLQAAALVGHNLKFIKKKKKKTGDFVKVGIGNIFGTELIKAQSQMVNS